MGKAAVALSHGETGSSFALESSFPLQLILVLTVSFICPQQQVMPAHRSQRYFFRSVGPQMLPGCVLYGGAFLSISIRRGINLSLA